MLHVTVPEDAHNQRLTIFILWMSEGGGGSYIPEGIFLMVRLLYKMI
jgi:hypothetical protein